MSLKNWSSFPADYAVDFVAIPVDNTNNDQVWES